MNCPRALATPLALMLLSALCACGCPRRSSEPAHAPGGDAGPIAAGAEGGVDLASFEAAPLNGYRALALSLGGGCALHESGRVACWGSDLLGVRSEFVASAQPRFIPSLSNIAQLTGGGGMCASRADGTTWCWGLGPWGATEGGFGHVPQRAAHLDGLRIALALPLDGRHGCGLSSAGELFCWGSNGSGQAGSPERVGDFGAYLPRGLVRREMTLVAAGSRHTCAADTRGALWCWGDGEGGALGDGSAHERECEWYTPESVAGGPPPHLARRCTGPDPYFPQPIKASEGPVTAVAAGWRSTCAVIRGELQCWGDQFGATARAVGIADVEEVAAAGTTFCARTRASAVWCWGSEPSGRWLSMSPRAIAPLAGVSTIAVAPLRVCGLVMGSVRCWGRNQSGLPIEDFTNVGPDE